MQTIICAQPGAGILSQFPDRVFVDVQAAISRRGEGFNLEFMVPSELPEYYLCYCLGGVRGTGHCDSVCGACIDDLTSMSMSRPSLGRIDAVPA